MAHIYSKTAKDGGKLWYVVFKDPNGRWTQRAAGRRHRDAQSLMHKIVSGVADGTFGMEEITYSEFSATWLLRREGQIKKTTYDDYRGVITRHLSPFFGELLLSQITASKIAEFPVAKRASCLSPRTINKCLTIFKMSLSNAVQWGYLKDNPARYMTRERETKQEMCFLTVEEIKRLLETCDPRFRSVFATAILTGVRQGELFALRRGDVDLEKRIIRVTRTYHPKHGFGEPKSRYGIRSVIITGELEKILSAHLKSTLGSSSDLLFPNSKGKPLNHQNLVKRNFRPALRQAGIKQIRFHDLRHTFAGLMISIENVNPKVLQRLMGHATLATTMDLYGHLLPEAMNGVGEKMDAALFPPEEDANFGGIASTDL